MSAAVRSTSPSGWRGWAATSTSSPTSATTRVAAASPSTSRSLAQQLVSGSVTADRTPTALATLDESGSAHYVFDIDWQLAGTPPRSRPPLVAHTGSIAAVLEPGCLAVAALLDAYHVSATITLRPERAAGADRRSKNRRAAESSTSSNAATSSRPARRTCSWIDPNRTPEQVAQTWLCAGPVDRRGDDGRARAFATCAAGMARVQARPVQVVDTVGAGDAFMVGLLDALWALGLLGAERAPTCDASAWTR